MYHLHNQIFKNVTSKKSDLFIHSMVATVFNYEEILKILSDTNNGES